MVSVIGEQAVIEGVMMKYEDKIAIAVRDPTGEIKIKKENLKFKESKIPFLRGVINLFIMLKIGIKSLAYSSQVALNEEKENTATLGISLVIAFIFAIALFKFLPLSLASLLDKKVVLSSLSFNIVDSGIRFVIFLGYIILISQMKDIKRVFQYHGAEHKAVNCYEAGKELTVKNVQSFTTVHKRCGTTFVFLVLFISMLTYLFIPKDLPFVEKLGLRILFLPLIASLSYEILRLGAKYNFLKPLIYPGLLVQKLTTREPDDKQVEVAIVSMKAVL